MIVERVEEAAEAIRRRSGGRGADRFADVAIVLGSGLGECASALTDAASIPYDELPHWPVSRVVGHPGRLVVGTLAGRRVAALAGRVHLYEGHDAASVVFATRVMGRLGIARIVLTNAAGGVNTRFAAGAPMLIHHHPHPL